MIWPNHLSCPYGPPLGPYGPGPYGLPWALMGRALMGRALMGPPGPSWAGPLWAPLGSVGRAVVGPRALTEWPQIAHTIRHS